jgi:hypothetical protein
MKGAKMTLIKRDKKTYQIGLPPEASDTSKGRARAEKCHLVVEA